MIAAHLTLKLEEKQTILETLKIKNRLDHLLKIMESEIDILQVEKRIRGRVKRQMEKVKGNTILMNKSKPFKRNWVSKMKVRI